VPRPPRVQIPGGIYHITSRGNRRQATFLDPDDHRFHLWCVDRTVARYGWTCGSWCHMPNHFHLLVRTPEPNLSRGMQYLNGLYGQVFNDRHEFSGHVFQGRFHSRLVEDDSHLVQVSRYIVMNPVRAGLCAHPLEWRWSSCRATMGLVAKPDFLDLGWLLGQFGRDLEDARRLYFALVEEALQEAA
jgi:putative transposase